MICYCKHTYVYIYNYIIYNTHMYSYMSPKLSIWLCWPWGKQPTPWWYHPPHGVTTKYSKTGVDEHCNILQHIRDQLHIHPHQTCTQCCKTQMARISWKQGNVVALVEERNESYLYHNIIDQVGSEQKYYIITSNSQLDVAYQSRTHRSRPPASECNLVPNNT